MRQSALTASILVICATLAGCVCADRPYNEPSQQKLQLESRTPQVYMVQVVGKADVPFGADGRVVLDVPRIGRGHATYLLGIKVSERSAEDIPAIVVKRNKRTVRKLSLSELKGLSTDSEGYSVVKVE